MLSEPVTLEATGVENTPHQNTGFAAMDVYKFIVKWAQSHKGNTPSLNQVARGCNLTSPTVHYHIQNLIKAGLLERIDGHLCVIRSSFVVHNHVYDT